MADKKRRTRRKFSEEFKRDAVELVRTTGRSVAEVARELSISETRWGTGSGKTALRHQQDRIDRGEAEGLTTEERDKLRELERENAELRMERDLLKRTVAFWVKESTQ